jgi:hypothetical protein
MSDVSECRLLGLDGGLAATTRLGGNRCFILPRHCPYQTNESDTGAWVCNSQNTPPAGTRWSLFVMGYKVKNGKAEPRHSKTLTLYHFTPPANLPKILRSGIYPFAKDANDHMLPGGAAIWLTSNPNGNAITPAILAYWRKCGSPDLVAEYESGKRKVVYGENEGGPARLTVELPKKFEGLFNYLELMTANYQVDSPKALAVIAEIPGVEDWWVVGSPADAQSFEGIGPGAITEVHPVGDPTPEYLAVIDAIAGESKATA